MLEHCDEKGDDSASSVELSVLLSCLLGWNTRPFTSFNPTFTGLGEQYRQLRAILDHLVQPNLSQTALMVASNEYLETYLAVVEDLEQTTSSIVTTCFARHRLQEITRSFSEILGFIHCCEKSSIFHVLDTYPVLSQLGLSFRKTILKAAQHSLNACSLHWIKHGELLEGGQGLFFVLQEGPPPLNSLSEVEQDYRVFPTHFALQKVYDSSCTLQYAQRVLFCGLVRSFLQVDLACSHMEQLQACFTKANVLLLEFAKQELDWTLPLVRSMFLSNEVHTLKQPQSSCWYHARSRIVKVSASPTSPSTLELDSKSEEGWIMFLTMQDLSLGDYGVAFTLLDCSRAEVCFSPSPLRVKNKQHVRVCISPDSVTVFHQDDLLLERHLLASSETAWTLLLRHQELWVQHASIGKLVVPLFDFTASCFAGLAFAGRVDVSLTESTPATPQLPASGNKILLFPPLLLSSLHVDVSLLLARIGRLQSALSQRWKADKSIAHFAVSRAVSQLNFYLQVHVVESEIAELQRAVPLQHDATELMRLVHEAFQKIKFACTLGNTLARAGMMTLISTCEAFYTSSEDAYPAFELAMRSLLHVLARSSHLSCHKLKDCLDPQGFYVNS